MQPIAQDLIYYYPKGHEAHSEYGHPERPERVEVMRQSLDQKGLWEAYPKVEPISLTPEFLQTVHTRRYLALLQEASQRGMHLDMDTYTTPASWQLALNAAGGAVAVASTVWRGEARRGFALTRPPGHHATSNEGMGFCLLNNVALAAEYLIQVEGAMRLAIVDLDLHHGNGTQDIFWQRGDVFYLSTHQYPFYPGTGSVEETGAGAGQGATANFPLPPGSGDQAFHAIMDDFILPLLSRFQPEMVLVSFGFDTHWRDPLGSLLLSATGYYGLIQKLARFCDESARGRLALFLEGGYDLNAAATCGQAAVAGLLGLTFEDPLGPAPVSETRYWMVMARRAREIWNL